MRVWCLFVLHFLPTLLFSQQVENPNRFKIHLQKYQETSSQENVSSTDILLFLDKLDSKRNSSKSDVDFLRVVFSKVHNRFLKHYEDYASFNDLLSHGSYNCLTGTAVYALVLDHFGFDYKVIETNYHIFLLVNTGKGRVLLEATDPQYGFVENEKGIEDRIKQYRQNKPTEASSDRSHYDFQFDLYNEVDLEELTGLLYYNLAINAFNHHHIEQAIDLLDLAATFYTSERIEEFSRVILMTVVHSNLENVTKQTYLNKVRKITIL